VSARPRIESKGPHRFKYRIDFDGLGIPSDAAAICISRPTNPTGNVVTDDEIRRLRELAGQRGIPLIVDNAYGCPFPGILFTDARPSWDRESVLTFSLSKLGLPGTRTGIVVAPPDIVSGIAAMNGVFCLASGNVGQALVRPLLDSDEILGIASDIIRPFYEQKARRALGFVDEFFNDALDYQVHACEGSLFLWIWFRGLPVSDVEMYERLKRRGVLVVPGSYFFFGLDDPGPHGRECIRINYTSSESEVREGIRIIGEEAERAYRGR
jgi:valine--pyruvate aminotransferase